MRLRFAMIKWDPVLSRRGRKLPKGLGRIPTLVCNLWGRCTDETGMPAWQLRETSERERWQGSDWVAAFCHGDKY